MRRTTKVWTILLAAACVAALAGPPDFSGSWTLNAEKSALGEGGRWRTPVRMTVTLKGDSLLVERVSRRDTGEERTSTERLSLDGKECQTGAPDRPRTSKAVWAEGGKQIAVSSSSVFERDGNRMEMTSVEIWALSEDGKALTASFVSTSPRGERKATYVYDRTP
jgi:hypothetical protein